MDPFLPDQDAGKSRSGSVSPDPAPAISGSGSVLAGSRSGLRFKRHGHGSVQALQYCEEVVRGVFSASLRSRGLGVPWPIALELWVCQVNQLS